MSQRGPDAPLGDPLAGTSPEVAEAIVAVEDAMSALAGRIRVMVRETAAQVDERLQPFGLRILRMLERHGDLAVGQVTECLGADPSSTSRQVRQLIDLGLAEAAACETDRRSKILSLTDHGRRRLAAIGPSGRVLIQQALSGWELADLERFAGYLHVLSDATAPASISESRTDQTDAVERA